MNLAHERQSIRPWLDLHSPADALTAYYALAHDEKRVQLALGRDESGRLNGFVAVCQTGMDLFRPLVVCRAASPEAAETTLRQALRPGRPYQAIVPPALIVPLSTVLDIHERYTCTVYEVRRSSFKPVINVLVTGARDAEGKPRFVIRSAAGEVVAESGLAWQSDHFAEVYVQVQAAARGRGLGRSVVSACTSYVLEAGLRPIYLTSPDNAAAVRVCQALGYADTGARECVCGGSGRLKVESEK